MCGISGFYNHNINFEESRAAWLPVLGAMQEKLKRRGPDDNGIYVADSCCLAHTRLAIINPEHNRQPLTDSTGNYTIVYNGEVYNLEELKGLLNNMHSDSTFKVSSCADDSSNAKQSYHFSDTEILLQCFIKYGADFIKKVNGIFAIAIYDNVHKTLFLFRDQLGVKPLYYSVIRDGLYRDTIVFASEMKALFEFPGLKPVINRESFCEVFGLGPAKTYGKGVFANVSEVLPGQYLVVNRYGVKKTTYWRLMSAPHEDSYEETVEKTSYLVTDAIRRQMVSDVPICTFLSGGLDSSLVSAVCAEELRTRHEAGNNHNNTNDAGRLTTFSFDFTDNELYFSPNSFQPSMDRPFVDKMVSHIGSDHHYLTCTAKAQADLLYDSVISRDLPTMADVDSSLLYFCSVVKDTNKVVLTGECADEVFGGYPWFHREDMLETSARNDTFCWSPDLTPRADVLNKEFREWLHLDEYVRETYENSVREINILPEDNDTETSRRRIAYLNLRWFMQTLLDRMDRTSMYNGLEARVPFADRKLVEYVFNVPWSMKARGGVVKNLLREAAKPYLPNDILYRKKSPYPKTYNPQYEKLIGERLTEIVEDASSPLNFCINKTNVLKLIHDSGDYGKPWYGQLMAGPQMIAYLIQVNHWLQIYN